MSILQSLEMGNRNIFVGEIWENGGKMVGFFEENGGTMVGKG